MSRLTKTPHHRRGAIVIYMNVGVSRTSLAHVIFESNNHCRSLTTIHQVTSQDIVHDVFPDSRVANLTLLSLYSTVCLSAEAACTVSALVEGIDILFIEQTQQRGLYANQVMVPFFSRHQELLGLFEKRVVHALTACLSS